MDKFIVRYTNWRNKNKEIAVDAANKKEAELKASRISDVKEIMSVSSDVSNASNRPDGWTYDRGQWMKEAAARYQDFKARGFIPEGSKYAAEDFRRQVLAELRGESYSGAYTNDAYERAYGVSVDYFTDETFDDVANQREDDLLDVYKGKLRDVLRTAGEGDFLSLVERYKDDPAISFDPSEIDFCETLDDLQSLINQMKSVSIWVFRKKTGRNRRAESNDLPMYKNDYVDALNELIQEIAMERTKFL
jgi:hypothetical protein